MQKLILILSFISICTLSSAQNTSVIETVFQSGEASGLKAEMAKDIELCIGDDVQFLSSSEAVASLNKWIKQVKPEKISGKLVGGSSVKYYNGQITTSKGSYRLFVYYSEKSGIYKIDEVRIGSK